MAKRQTAISRYKTAARKIKRDRAAGRLAEVPVSQGHYFCRQDERPAPAAMQNAIGEWYVVQFRSRLAGPFDTRAEAQAWIDEQ
jgi:hypothetical protein